MIRLIIISALLFLFYENVCSQSICVVDAISQNPIPFATIEVVDIKLKKRSVFQSDINGKAAINMATEGPSKKYYIHIITFAYTPYSDTLIGIKDSLIIALKKIEQQLEEVVITGESTPIEKEKSVYQIKIISEEKIKTMAAQNLRDVLTNQMNIRISQDNVLGSFLSMNGLSGQAVKIMIDGVPMIGRLNGNIDLSQINLNNIERIEIIDGPMAVKYGTDAIGGVINIITKKTFNKKLGNKTLVYYESNGTYNTHTTLFFTRDKHQFNVSLGRNFFDGWRPDEKNFYFEKIKMADTTRNKIWKPKEQYYSSLVDNVSFKKALLVLYSDVFYEIIDDKGKPKPPYYETAFDNIYKTWRDNQKIQFNTPLFSSGKLDIVISRNFYKRIKNTYFKDLTTLEKTLTTNSDDQDTSVFQMYMSRGVYTNKLFKNYFEIGYDIYTENTHSSIIFNKKQTQSDLAAFISYNLELKDKIKIKPGLRASYNSLYATPLIPSIHVLYNFNKIANDNSQLIPSIRLSYSKGFRTPSLKEMYLNFVDINHNIIGNNSLKPELSDFFNGSINSNFYTNSIKIKTSISLFYNSVYNLIQLAQINNNTNQYTYINIGKTKTSGANFNLNGEYKNFQCDLSVAYIGLNYPDVNKTTVLFYPEIVFNSSYTIKKIKARLNLFSKYNGKLPYYSLVNNDTQNYSLNYTKDYLQIDANYSVFLFKEKINISLGVKNLLNNTFLNFSTGGAHASGGMYISTGRTYFIQCILNLSK